MKWVLVLLISISAIAGKAPKHIIYKTQSVVGQKLCYTGDTGTGKEGQYLVADAMEAEGCSKVFIAGDMIYTFGMISKKSKQLKEKFLIPYKKLINKGVTFHVSTGNHDYLLREKVWNKIHKDYDFVTHPNLFYAEIYKDVCFITIDSTSVAHYIYLGRQLKQKLWLKKLKEELKDHCSATIALGHHPVWSAGDHGDANKYFARFAKKQLAGVFDMYIAGHDHHLSHEGESKGTTFLVSGAGAKLRPLKYPARGPFAKSVLGYVVVEVQKDQGKTFLNYQFKGVDSEGKPYLLFEEEKQALGYR